MVSAGEVCKDKAAGDGLLFFRIGHVVCCLSSKVRRQFVSLHSFFVDSLTAIRFWRERPAL
jgi:hypothetical protein